MAAGVPPLVWLAGGGLALYWLSQRSSSSRDGQARRAYTPDQVIAAIFAEVQRRNLPVAIAQGLHANAWAESALDPWAVGPLDGGHAVGLYQIRDDGLGRGVTIPLGPPWDGPPPPPHIGWDIGVPQATDFRCDPTLATGFMCDAIGSTGAAAALRTAPAMASNGEWWASAICLYIEQPANAAAAATYRASLVRTWYGS